MNLLTVTVNNLRMHTSIDFVINGLSRFQQLYPLVQIQTDVSTRLHLARLYIDFCVQLFFAYSDRHIIGDDKPCAER